jgi:hypothetical protein
MAKKKIMLLSDDLRMHSGIATESRELVLGTADRFDWVQLAGAVTHPEKGKIQDMSEATNKLLNRNDCYVKLYPIDGYGDEDTLFAVMNMERPDAILHFTDPRFWTWLYMIERQVRSKIPLTYLNIWDDLPYPMYNRPYYESCDALMSISKQTYNINKQVLGPERCISIDGMWDKNGNFLPFKTSDSPIKKIRTIDIETLKDVQSGKVSIKLAIPKELIGFVDDRSIFIEKAIELLNGETSPNGTLLTPEVIKTAFNFAYDELKKLETEENKKIKDLTISGNFNETSNLKSTSEYVEEVIGYIKNNGLK